MHVEVVVGVLARRRAAPAISGRTTGGRAERRRAARSAAHRVGARDEQPQLRELPLARGLTRAPGASPARARRSPARSRSRGPQRAGRRAGCAAGRRRSCAPRRPAADRPRRRRARRAGRSASPPAASGTAIALTVKSRSPQVGLDRSRRGGGVTSSVPGAICVERAPGAELRRELEAGPAGDLGDPRRERGAPARRRRGRGRPPGDRARRRGPRRRRSRPSAPGASASRAAPDRRGARRARRRASRDHVLARDAGRDPGGDLVVDRPQSSRELLGEDPLAALGRRSDHHLGPGRDLGLRPEVDRQVVHRDRPDDRSPPAPDEHARRCRSAPVARRRRSRSAATPIAVGASGAPAAPVADAVAGLEAA